MRDLRNNMVGMLLTVLFIASEFLIPIALADAEEHQQSTNPQLPTRSYYIPNYCGGTEDPSFGCAVHQPTPRTPPKYKPPSKTPLEGNPPSTHANMPPN